MRLCVVFSAAVCCLICTLPADAASPKSPEHGRVHISGIVAKLVREHRVTIHSNKREVAYSARLNKFPLDVRLSDFGTADLDFVDDAGNRVFSVLFTKPLFKDSNSVAIRLNHPIVEVHVHTLEDGLRIRYWTWVTQDVAYSTMPRWDREADKLVAAENPTVEIRLKGGSKPIASDVMAKNRSGYGWHTLVSLPKEVAAGTELSITIALDTGDLFGRLSADMQHIVK